MGGVTEHGGHDHRLHPSSLELGGDRVAHVMQSRFRMEAGQPGKGLERARQRVRVDEESIPPIAHQGDRTPQLVERIPPSHPELGGLFSCSRRWLLSRSRAKGEAVRRAVTA
jgi:hypothetical protein